MPSLWWLSRIWSNLRLGGSMSHVEIFFFWAWPKLMTSRAQYGYTNVLCIIQPRLSGLCLSGSRLSGLAGDQKIHYHAYTESMANDFYRWKTKLYELWTLQACLGQNWLTKVIVYFSEHYWPWSYYIGVYYRLGILNQVRNVGISIIWTISLIGHLEVSRDQGVWIIDVLLYWVNMSGIIFNMSTIHDG